MNKVPDMGDDTRRAEAEEQRLRRRMLEGQWDEDLRQAMRVWLGPLRTTAIGKLSRSMNLFKSSTTQLAVNYDLAPVVDGDADSIDEFRAILERMKWVGLMRRHNARVVGIRESLIKVQYAESTNRITMRLVPPDLVNVKTDDDDVDHLLEVREARLRTPEGGKEDIYWDVHDCETGETIIEDGEGKDVTNTFAPDGIAVLKDTSGKSIKVWHLYHAEPSDQVWNAFDWCEIVDGAFDVATMWNGLRASLRDASHAQRVMTDLEAPTAETTEQGVSVAPAGVDSVLMLRTAPGKTSGSIGQWEPPVNPKDIAESILTFQKTFLATVNLFPGDLQEKRSESGIAIQIKRSAQRRFAQSMEPQLREADEELFVSIAKVHNAYVKGAVKVAEEGYSITYKYADDPVGDRIAEIEYNAKLVELGWLSQAQAYRAVHPGITSDEDALTLLIRAQMQQNALKAASMGSVLVPDEVVDAYEAASENTQRLLDLFPDLPADVVDTLRSVAQLAGEDGEPAPEQVAADEPGPVPEKPRFLVGELQAAQKIVQDVAAGAIPRETGINMMVELLGIERTVAETVMGSVGRTFTPEEST